MAIPLKRETSFVPVGKGVSMMKRAFSGSGLIPELVSNTTQLTAVLQNDKLSRFDLIPSRMNCYRK